MKRTALALLLLATIWLAIAGGYALTLERGLARGVILDVGDSLFFPADNSPPIRIVDDKLLFPNWGACVTLAVEYRTVKSLAPIDYSDHLEPDVYRDERVMVIKRIDRIKDYYPNRHDRECRLPQLQKVRGLFTTADIEHSSFSPVGSTEVWWLELPSWAGAIDVSPRTRSGRGMAVSHACVEALGVVGPSGMWGHLGTGNRMLVITEVLWSAPHLIPQKADWRDASSCIFPD